MSIYIDPKIKELIDKNPNGARFALENFCIEAAVKYSAAYGPVEGLRQFFKDMIEQYEHLGRPCHLQNGETKPSKPTETP